MPPHKPTLKELIENTRGLPLEARLLRGDEVPPEAIQKRLALIAKSKTYTPYYKEVVSAFLKEKLEARRATENQ